MNPTPPTNKISRAQNGYLKNLTGRVQPQINPLGQFCPEISRPCSDGILKPRKPVRISGNIEGRGEVLCQTVMRLITVDQPQGHPLFVRVEIENPSLQFHRAPLRFEELSRRHANAFLGRVRWKEESPPSGCRGTDRSPLAYSSGPEQTTCQSAADLPGAAHA